MMKVNGVKNSFLAQTSELSLTSLTEQARIAALQLPQCQDTLGPCRASQVLSQPEPDETSTFVTTSLTTTIAFHHLEISHSSYPSPVAILDSLSSSLCAAPEHGGVVTGDYVQDRSDGSVHRRRRGGDVPTMRRRIRSHRQRLPAVPLRVSGTLPAAIDILKMTFRSLINEM